MSLCPVKGTNKISWMKMKIVYKHVEHCFPKMYIYHYLNHHLKNKEAAEDNKKMKEKQKRQKGNKRKNKKINKTKKK